MIKQIRTSKISKIIACYLSLMMFIQITQPMQLYALTEGPSQPEFNSFTPIGTSDMVDLASGDFNYNIPIMDVGGYPINLAYNSGVTMDQEASWVGLGWNLNIGQINRNVRGLPDDFKGDTLRTVNNLKTNVTVGVNPYINFQIIAANDNAPNSPSFSLGTGLDVQYNNYSGLTAVPSFGPSFNISSSVAVGMQLTSSREEGVSVTPSMSLSTRKFETGSKGESYSATISPSITYNSRQGLQSFNLSSSVRGHDASKTRSVTLSNGSGGISFVNNTFTPTKRLAMKNNNIRFSFSVGPNVWGFHGEVSIAGYASVQKLADKNQFQKSYGYENTDFAGDFDLQDFNREKEQAMVSQSTMVLPVTNYTYDLYSIQGQDVSGMFRPFRGQVGQVYDSKVVDQSASNSFGFEIEGGAGVHKGFNFRTTNTNTYTGNWQTVASPFFKDKNSGNLKDYEKVYYKNIGEMRVDQESGTLLNTLKYSSPITLEIDVAKNATNKYKSKVVVGNQSLLSEGVSFNSAIKRTHREKRNQVVQKITKKEVLAYNLSPFFKPNSDMIGTVQLAPNHHTAGYIVTDENSNRHIYGETVYNKVKKEVSFNVGNGTVDQSKGLVTYGSADNTTNNTKGRDNYFNSVNTPAYAHTYLLTSVLSSDYEDLSKDGPTDDDLGTYTKFTYEDKGDYKWRVPYQSKQASFNEGLKTDKLDQKGSYLYGVKENKYLKRIETKTHVAFIDLEERKDGLGARDENGGRSVGSSDRMYKISSIRLYSKPEALKGLLLNDNPLDDDPSVMPIKTAHFIYNYSLCQEIDNTTGTGQETGKLTLEKVYFTYKGSNMGKYTPYVFNYSESNLELNPKYNPKAYDIWGNYKKFETNSWLINSDLTTPQEFPYVDQSNKDKQDKNASAWSLRSIKLPSGGIVSVEYESDDYKYVQDKRAMQMFKIDGVTNATGIANYGANTPDKDKLYKNGFDAEYVVIKLPPPKEGEEREEPEQIRRRYTEELRGKAIYFNFLLNMTSSDYEYVSGYFKMDKEAIVSQEKDYLFIPMERINREGKSSGDLSNPISVAGWFFGRQNLNPQINDLEDPSGSTSDNVVALGRKIVNDLGELINVFKGGNKRLMDMGCAKTFKPNKSWIRLLEPKGSKMGGGSRVKKVLLHDQWENMIDVNDGNHVPDPDRYSKQYGQEYDYTLDGNTSSGVATYEPNISKENPLVMPFYNKPEKLTAQSYQEKPFGESFFPTPTVTYSKVTVKNVTASTNPTRTGSVVTYHYTSRDFPTITDFTNLDKSKRFESNENQVVGNMLKGMLGLKVNIKTDLTMTQGFVIETNDMNGKLKKQEVYNNSKSLISKVEYKYSVKSDNEKVLENKLPTIDEEGKVRNDLEIATHYDIINDFRESFSHTNSYGAGINVDALPVPPFGIYLGWGIPERAEHRQVLRTAVTTKVIHRSGILKEKIAFDLGSKVSTKNHAWDAKTGQVLLTETINEFDDKYYTLNYPAYWYYKGMGMASENIDIAGNLEPVGAESDRYFKISGAGGDISRFLKPGDELAVQQPNIEKKFWVTGYNQALTAVSLINASGARITGLANSSLYNSSFRVIRSGYKNQQMASMASITLMKNPIKYDPDGINGKIDESLLNYTLNEAENPKIINASAVQYDEHWESQSENGLPRRFIPSDEINEYLYNIRGEWRPRASHAYLTGRNSADFADTRNLGYFKTFNPYYRMTSTGWKLNGTGWTFASEVTKYNPYGVEIENKDALNRFSAAQYGYKYKLPIAVASNSEYRQMGFDGFEDYDPSNWDTSTPSSQKPHFSVGENARGKTFIINHTAHTGKRCAAINEGESISFVRKIECEDLCSYPASFDLYQNENYVISGWLKLMDGMVYEDDRTSLAELNLPTYETVAFIRVSFRDGNGDTVGTDQIVSPKGNLIDGWQLMKGEFSVPTGAAEIVIVLDNHHNDVSRADVALFDDIRVHPVKSNMKSFVYDQETHKLMAELDENNYATFYEYDKEGGLVRVKKETEKGIFTIQETRSSSRKEAQE